MTIITHLHLKNIFLIGQQESEGVRGLGVHYWDSFVLKLLKEFKKSKIVAGHWGRAWCWRKCVRHWGLTRHRGAEIRYTTWDIGRITTLRTRLTVEGEVMGRWWKGEIKPRNSLSARWSTWCRCWGKSGWVSRREFGWKFGRESSLGSSLEFGWVHALEEVSTILHFQNFENKNGRFPDEKKKTPGKANSRDSFVITIYPIQTLSRT